MKAAVTATCAAAGVGLTALAAIEGSVAALVVLARDEPGGASGTGAGCGACGVAQGRPGVSVDREQVRRDAESLATLPAGTNQGRQARQILALLAELEQGLTAEERAGLWCCTLEDREAQLAEWELLWRRVEQAERGRDELYHAARAAVEGLHGSAVRSSVVMDLRAALARLTPAARGALESAAWGDGFPGASPQAVPPAAAPTLEERRR